MSILFTAIIRRWTPIERARRACSFVWPRRPDSKLPPDASMTSTAKSA